MIQIQKLFEGFIFYICYECFEYELNYNDYIYEKFDYEALAKDLRQLSEKEAKKSIVRYMQWQSGFDDYDPEVIHQYYKQLLDDPPYYGRWGRKAEDYLLFRHYPALDETF
jgi:hypothetical protein